MSAAGAASKLSLPGPLGAIGKKHIEIATQCVIFHILDLVPEKRDSLILLTSLNFADPPKLNWLTDSNQTKWSGLTVNIPADKNLSLGRPKRRNKSKKGKREFLPKKREFSVKSQNRTFKLEFVLRNTQHQVLILWKIDILGKGNKREFLKACKEFRFRNVGNTAQKSH
ncbi:hypothetical protein NQ317_013480 [Molorchus minor]|uniref:Uncharacterized protein n=1 Tax=Molorchus minor TaxID=1323400 RepID=A0ABQ9JBA9_9CUCU|nr:hypothetical protein NQ317_013480 [Molorchus minor]